MKSHFVPCALIGVLFFLGGCQEETTTPALTPTPVAGTDSIEPSAEYDANSWRDLIAEDCSSFFDGCNRCLRGPGRDLAACTRKACEHYEAPRCLDEEEVSEPGAVILDEPDYF